MGRCSPGPTSLPLVAAVLESVSTGALSSAARVMSAREAWFVHKIQGRPAIKCKNQQDSATFQQNRCRSTGLPPDFEIARTGLLRISPPGQQPTGGSGVNGTRSPRQGPEKIGKQINVADVVSASVHVPAKFLVSIRSHLAMVGSKLAGIPTLTFAKLPSSYQSNATRSGPTKKNPLRASETLCRCLFGTGLQASSSILRINPPAIRVLQYARGKAGPCTSRSEPSLASFARDLRTQGVCGFSSGPQSVPDGRGRAEAKKRNWQPRPPVTIRRALASRNEWASMLAGLWLPMKLLAPLCPALCVRLII